MLNTDDWFCCLGSFTSNVRSLVNFKLYANSAEATLRSVNCQSCYNALCNSQIITNLPNWPKFTLHDVALIDDYEIEDAVDDQTSEFIPGVFSIRTNWTENAAAKQSALDQMEDGHFPINYFEKPGGLFDTVVVSHRFNLFPFSNRVLFLDCEARMVGHSSQRF